MSALYATYLRPLCASVITVILPQQSDAVVRQLAQREDELYSYVHRRHGAWTLLTMELFPLPFLFMYLKPI